LRVNLKPKTDSAHVNEDKSVRYHRLRRQASVLSLVLTAGLLSGLLLSGATLALRGVAASVVDSPAAQVAVYLLLLGLLQEIVGLPLAFYRTFVLERQYGLSFEPLSVWIRDHVKALLIGGTLALGAVEIVYATLRWSPRWWWAASAAAFMAATVLLAKLAPIVLLPIFYRFKPLDRDSLRARLLALSQRAGVPVLGVYEWGLGEKTRRANAALVGTGRTRRILVSDTLLEQYSDDEIEVILAHELGHHVHHDILKALLLDVALLLVSFYTAALALARWWGPLGLTSLADVAGLPLLLLVGGGASLAAAPALNAISRFNERRADRYALTITRQPLAFVSAMRRLAAQNLAEEQPSRTTLWFFHTHPPISERIEAAKAFNGVLHAEP
jgi:STE24 endopeptidase